MAAGLKDFILKEQKRAVMKVCRRMMDFNDALAEAHACGVEIQITNTQYEIGSVSGLDKSANRIILEKAQVPIPVVVMESDLQDEEAE